LNDKSTNEDAILRLFGLKQNPFAGDFQNELTTLRQINQGARVDGFIQAEANVTNWSKPFANEQSDKPCIVLIYGPRGSGRSSAARFVALKCAEKVDNWRLKQPEAKNYPDRDLLQRYFIKYQVEDDHPIKPVRETLGRYYDRLFELGVNIPAKNAELEKLWMDTIGKEATNAVLRTLFSRTRLYAIAVLPWPILCFDNIRNINQIIEAAAILDRNVILVLTTSLSTVASEYCRRLKEGLFHGLLVELGELTPNDVNILITRRWEEFGLGGQPPLPREGISKVFEHGFPLRAVIRILAGMLSDHAGKWLLDGKPDPAPPMSQEIMYSSALKALKDWQSEEI